MAGDLTLRRYRPGDRERVEAVMESALRDAGAFFEDVPDDDPDALAPGPDEGGREFLVGEVGGRIVATGGFRPVGGFVAEALRRVPEGAVELKRLHVHPEHQRRGYGQRLLDALRLRARDQGYTEALLATTDLQPAARAFYEANGFEAVERLPLEVEGRSFDVVVYRGPVGE